MRLKWWLAERRYWWYQKPRERLVMWLVGKLPRALCARAAIRVMAHATTGQWSNQVVPDLKAMEALERWDQRPWVIGPGKVIIPKEQRDR